MSAVVRAEGGSRPVKSIRFKKSGEWKNVTAGYIVDNGVLKRWWPDRITLTGSTESAIVTPTPYAGNIKFFTKQWTTTGYVYLITDGSSTNDAYSYDIDNFSTYVDTVNFYEYRFAASTGDIGSLDKSLSAFDPIPITYLDLPGNTHHVWVDRYGLREPLAFNDFGTVLRIESYNDAEHAKYYPSLMIGALPILDDGGYVSTFNYGYQNGFWHDAYFKNITAAGIDPDGETVWILDSANCAIRKANLTTGAVETVAGEPPNGTIGTEWEYPNADDPTVTVVSADGVGVYHPANNPGGARFGFATNTGFPRASALVVHNSGDFLLVYDGSTSKWRRMWLKETVHNGVTKQQYQVETLWVNTYDFNAMPYSASSTYQRGIPTPKNTQCVAMGPNGDYFYVMTTWGVYSVRLDLDWDNPTVDFVCGSFNQSGYVDSTDPAEVRFQNVKSIRCHPTLGDLYVADVVTVDSVANLALRKVT